MSKIIYQGIDYPCQGQETVLDTFLRHGVHTAFSCRNGVCQVCMLRATKGIISEDAQTGLKKSLVARNYFLACQYTPESDIEVAQPRPADLFNRAVVYKKEWLTPDICRLFLEPATELYYHAGQFINLLRKDGLLRSYSLASVPFIDVHLELHVKRIPGGKMSNWILDELQEGDELEVQGANGHSYYSSGKEEQNILLVGTGTGLAPLIGIIRDALASGHKGAIHLYHGSRYQRDVYCQDILREQAEQYPNFHYTLCVTGEDVSADYMTGRACQAALMEHPKLGGWQVFLCGNPGMVYTMKEEVQALGVDVDEIHIDPFELSHIPMNLEADANTQQQVSSQVTNLIAVEEDSANGKDEQNNAPANDPEMWSALKQGVLLTEILDEFYTRVYQDPLLSPYFEDVSKEWVAQKQFSFLYQMFTGEKVFLGNRPRNAHHWMVISDTLFDYRENIMVDCLRNHGLADNLIKRWQKMEESFRKDIIKSKPWNKILDGIEIPAEGYKEISLDMGGICDNCLNPIAAGEVVRYHVRLASVYCQTCMAKQNTVNQLNIE